MPIPLLRSELFFDDWGSQVLYSVRHSAELSLRHTGPFPPLSVSPGEVLVGLGFLSPSHHGFFLPSSRLLRLPSLSST